MDEKQMAQLSERKTVHKWLNEAGIPHTEEGQSLCLLRRLRIAVDIILTSRAELQSPYSTMELMHSAINGQKLNSQRVVATFGDRSNWTQVYGGTRAEGGPVTGCTWGWIGPVKPPYELAENAAGNSTPEKETIF